MNVLIAFGANLGNPQKTYQHALNCLSQHLQQIRSSHLYATEPHYDKPGAVIPKTNVNEYVNAVFTATTPLDPHELLDLLLQTEAQFGRKRPADDVCAPRSIDLDLILADNLVIQSPDLILPHPRMHTRNFVLIPAAEIANSWVHPVLKRSIGDLAKCCSDSMFIRKISD